MTYLCFIISLFSTCTTCFLIFFTNLTSCVRRKNINFYYVVWNLSAILHKKTNSEDTFLIQKINRMGLSSTSHHSLQFYSLSYVWIWELPLALDLQPARSVFFSGNFKKNSKLVAKCKERPPRFVKKKFS